LAEEAQRVAGERPSIIGIHGGDGTLHRTLSALIAAYGPRPLPPIAILPGGTMNVVASSLGIHVDPERLLAELVSGAREGKPPATLRRRCIRVGDDHGFIFGSGLLSNFLEEYYARGRYGGWRAVWVILRIVVSLITFGPYARRIFRRMRVTVTVDGAALAHSQLTGIGAATVSEIGFRFKLHQHADNDPDRMAVVAIFCRPLSLLLDLLSVRLGKGISPRRATSVIATRVELVPAESPICYTLDGDMYACQGPLAVELGPVLEIVRPQEASGNATQAKVR
jgi:diacylglycerol kinase family enzyme